MILKRLVLENYCLFSGRHEFDLEPRLKNGAVRPIVLFGGKNGAGKTTLLSAIQLALYGRHSVGSRLSEREYHLALRNRIRRNGSTEQRASFAKVGLEFEVVIEGERHIFYIERSWISAGDNGVQEFFKAEKDRKPLDEVSPEHWQSFIADIVPERLAQLFFFDGEKIKTIAEDITSNAAISDAIQTLLGLDTVKALQADLNIYRSKLLKTANPEAYDQEIAGVQAAMDKLELERARLKTERENINNRIQSTKERLTYLESQLQARGADFALASGGNQTRRDALRARQSALEEQIRVECEAALPFMLCPTTGQRLIVQLEREGAAQKGRLLDKEISTLEDGLLQAAQEKLPNVAATELGSFLKEELRRYRESRRPKEVVVEVHRLSDRDAALMIETVQRSAPAAAKRMHEILAELERITRELHQVERDLDKAPAEQELQSPFELLKEQNQLLGQHEERRRHSEQQLHDVELALTMRGREKRQIESRLQMAHEVTLKTGFIEKLQPALAVYIDRLTRAKISALQSEVTECYNRLARKGDFVRRVEIDPGDFSVTLIDKAGRSIPKQDLSSGEKQIFAIAMLWGLSRTSGRPLPVVIDTPLGRLDSDHRRNLIKNYFPHAGYQVILLSTDTEVDLPLFKELSPSVSHCYHLRYDEQEHCTYAETQYFWRERAIAQP